MKLLTTQIVTQPSVEPLSLTEVKLALRRPNDFIAEDAFFSRIIKAARLHCEKFLNRKLITQSWAAWFDEFPCSSDKALELPFPPVSSVTHVKYVDTNGTTQTWSSSNYLAQTAHEPARIIPAYSVSWPSVRDTPNTDAEMVNGSVRVQFACGYGAAGSSVPEDTRTAMHTLIGHWYENRDAFTAAEVPDAVERAVHALLWPERCVSF